MKRITMRSVLKTLSKATIEQPLLPNHNTCRQKRLHCITTSDPPKNTPNKENRNCPNSPPGNSPFNTNPLNSSHKLHNRIRQHHKRQHKGPHHQHLRTSRKRAPRLPIKHTNQILAIPADILPLTPLIHSNGSTRPARKEKIPGRPASGNQVGEENRPACGAGMRCGDIADVGEVRG